MTESVLFTKTQTRLLNELKQKHEQGWFRELNSALEIIYEELGMGLTEKAADGKYRFEIQPGFTGVNVTNTEPTPTIPGKA
jgi:hypothetical protein